MPVQRPTLRPYRSAPPDRYCRLFPPSERPDEDAIKDLGALAFSMLRKDDQSAIPPTLMHGDPPLAGYTYFGQFIDHNLTEDDTAMRDAGEREPRETVNYRGPWLNLSGIYDRTHDRGGWRQLYERDGVSFRLGRPRRLSNNEPFDLPLDGDGYPVLTDDRNNENIIVRQIHVMFLKLHNLAIQELTTDYPSLNDRELFARVQDRVCWQYQYLVRHDFLRKVCKGDVFEELILNNGQPNIDWKAGGFSIPVELAQAALRFGHSLVRSRYDLNVSRRQVPLRDLLCSGEPRALTLEEAVDWPSFLGDVGEFAMRIDTAIASPLFGLEAKDIHSYVDTPMPHLPNPLPVRTLVRSAKSRLPTGQDVALQLGVPLVQQKGEMVGQTAYEPGEHLRLLGLSETTPLWYYLLLEAEVCERGATLGELGSRLIIETVNGALREDPNSYMSQHGPGWTPDCWKKTGKKVERMLDLARLVGLSD